VTMTKLLSLVRLLLIVIAKATTLSAYDACNICRAPNVVNNKNARIRPFIVRLRSWVNTCNDLNERGENGRISENYCLYIQSLASIRRSCGCGPKRIRPKRTSNPSEHPRIEPIKTPKPKKGQKTPSPSEPLTSLEPTIKNTPRPSEQFQTPEPTVTNTPRPSEQFQTPKPIAQKTMKPKSSMGMGRK
jgi:hypothetical protein